MGFAQPNYLAGQQVEQPFTTSLTLVAYNAAGIAALQSKLTTAYSDLSFTYTGTEFNYVVTLTGSTRSVTGSIDVIYPSTPTFTLQPSQYGPTFDQYSPGNYPVPRWW
jgi:hypothetical protein